MAKKDIPDYYEGGHRILRRGVPTRTARKPTLNMRQIMKGEGSPGADNADLALGSAAE